MSRFFLNDVYYFITCPTVDHQSFFTSSRKDFILGNLFKSQMKFGVRNLDYGINSNHYHLLGYFDKGIIIPQFLKNINGPAAMAVNKLDCVIGRKIWDNYHIYYIDREEVLYKVKGYVIGNPYKHNEVESIEKLRDYNYSSFKKVLEMMGIKTAEDMVLSVIGMNESDFKKEMEKYKVNANKMDGKRE